MVRAIQFDQPAGQQYLPFIPADRLQSELRVNFRKVGTSRLHNLYARAGVEHNFAQNRIFSAFDTETSTPGYTLVNVGLGSEITNSKDRTLFSVYLAANNLFDVAYQNHLSRLKYTAVNYATGRVGVGYVQGFGLQRGALASSIAHDAHNIVAVGTDDADILRAIAVVAEDEGGLAAVADGEILAHMALPIAGILSDLPLAETAAAYERLEHAARGLGSTLPSPFGLLAFMALSVIPEARVTDSGFVTV
jgi:hypothetical protein